MDATKPHEPLTLAAGDSVVFTRSVPNHSAKDGWTCKYEARGGGALVEWVATVNVDGASFDVDIAPGVTALYESGQYVLEGAVSNAALAQRFTFYLGHLKVTPNLEGAPAELDTRTHAQIVLEEIEKVLEARATGDLVESAVLGSRFKLATLKELRDMRDDYLREVAKEKAIENVRNGKPSGKKARLRYLVTNPAGGLSQFGAGSNQENFEGP